MRAELARKRETVAALDSLNGGRSEASRARVRARLEAFRQMHAAAKAAGQTGSAPATREIHHAA